MIETAIKFCLKNWTEEGQDQLVSVDPVTLVKLSDAHQFSIEITINQLTLNVTSVCSIGDCV